jgi:adenylyltransferase/sulfurtransferase
VVDGTDNFPTRYLVNDACVLLGKPNVHGSIFRFEGQASVFGTPGGPCYRCLYPEPPPPGLVPSCAEGGVLGVLPGIIGTIQATETIKLILGSGAGSGTAGGDAGGGISLSGRLLLFDAWGMTFRELKLRRDPACPMCGEQRSIHALIDYEQFCGLSGHEAPAAVGEISALELKRRIDSGEAVQLVDVREPYEHAIASIPGARLIPLSQVVARMAELEPGRELVVHCKVGVRSERAIAMLKAAGYQGAAVNLAGGIAAWSQDVDPSVPSY